VGKKIEKIGAGIFVVVSGACYGCGVDWGWVSRQWLNAEFSGGHFGGKIR
jgi:hypothetical protein